MMKKIKVRNSLVNLTDMIGVKTIVLLKIKKKLKQDLKLVRILNYLEHYLNFILMSMKVTNVGP